MLQLKISYDENQIEYYKKSVERRRLMQSAELLNEVCAEDSESKELTNQAIQEWPEHVI
jgi:hypothetical protein